MNHLIPKFEELEKLLSNSKDKKILLICDSDPDGLTSAFVFTRLLQKLGYSYKAQFDLWPVTAQFRNTVSSNADAQNKMREYDIIILFDYQLNDYSFIKDKITCVIDHHRVRNDVTTEINPTIGRDELVYPSSSAITYAIYRHILDDNEVVRKVAFLGAIADRMVYGSLDYLDLDIIKSKSYFSNNGMIIPAYHNLLKIFNLISVSKDYPIRIYEYMINNVTNSTVPLDVLPKEWTRKINQLQISREKVISKVYKRIEEVGDLMFLDIDEKETKFKESINSFLELHYPDKSSFVITKIPSNKGYSYSGRSKKIDLTKLIEFLKKEVPGLKGGGHPFAAGFFSEPKTYKRVKKIIIDSSNKFPQ